MADLTGAKSGVEVDARPNPELTAWTSTLYNHLLKDPEQKGLPCKVRGVEYHIAPSFIGGDEPGETAHQFVSIVHADGSGDETFFYVTDVDQVGLNIFAEGPGNGLPFLKAVCAELKLKVITPPGTTGRFAKRVADIHRTTKS